MSSPVLEPFVVDVAQARLDELRDRLATARLPEPETDPSQGIGLERLDALRRTWAWEYDWRIVERQLNAREQYRTEIDGLGLHVLVARSERPDARPLLITHGWPGCVVESLDVLDGLSAPPADQPAFHVVVPSLPGFGFSDRPSQTGWGMTRTVHAWAELMSRLGFERFLVQGGDAGSVISAELAVRYPERVEALHTHMPMALPPEHVDPAALTATERRWLEEAAEFQAVGYGYVHQQSTRPQTLGYALVESPIALLAWNACKIDGWTDWTGHPSDAVPTNRLLDMITTYWLTATGASSIRFYWESLSGGRAALPELPPVTVPSAVSVFPQELMKLPRAWVAARYVDLRYWNELDRGGHYPSLEAPDLFVDEMRAAFHTIAPAG